MRQQNLNLVQYRGGGYDALSQAEWRATDLVVDRTNFFSHMRMSVKLVSIITYGECSADAVLHQCIACMNRWPLPLADGVISRQHQ
ncbi:MAG TPA: hypothetical protein VFV87_13035, partial [Pirellulaceae bacterium]|nr:hypothetical protein [Pirellulaceae bacterium]